MKHSSAGIGLIEVLFVLLLTALLAAIAVPRLPMGAVRKQSVKTAAHQLAADLRWARQSALAGAAQNPSGYELVMEGTEPYTGYSIRNRQTGQTVSSFSFSSGLVCTGGKTFAFGPLGNLLTGSASQIQISADGVEFNLTVIPATGAVVCRKQD